MTPDLARSMDLLTARDLGYPPKPYREEPTWPLLSLDRATLRWVNSHLPIDARDALSDAFVDFHICLPIDIWHELFDALVDFHRCHTGHKSMVVAKCFRYK
jgi:hypothetical protein